MQSSTIAQIAGYVAGLKLSMLPSAAVHVAKRLLADTICSAAPGFDGRAAAISRGAFAGVSGPLRASVWGHGEQIWAPGAAVINGAMLREPEINDTFRGKTPGHHSELFPTAVALCEALDRPGETLLLSSIAGYEIYARLCHVARIVGGERGWHHTSLGIVVTPAVAARCLGLDEAQTAQAIAVSASYGITTNELHHGAVGALRSLAFPLAAQGGIISALLAREGLAGPAGAIDGRFGLFPQLVGDDFDLAPLNDWSEPLILGTNIKRFGCSYLMHSALAACGDAIERLGAQPSQIQRIEVGVTRRPYEVVAESEAAAPKTVEAADHSLPFCLGVLAVRGSVLPGDFTQETLSHPGILQIARSVEVRIDPDLDRDFPFEVAWPAIVSIKTTDGRTATAKCIHPPGDHRTPLSDQQLFEKFDALMSSHFSSERRLEIWETVFSLEKLESTRRLVALLVRNSG